MNRLVESAGIVIAATKHKPNEWEVRGEPNCLLEGCDGVVIAMDHLDVTADHIKYIWILTGTNDGPGGTGNKVHVSGVEEWIIDEDGLIAESRGHFDNEEYQRQLEHGVEESDKQGGDE